MYSDAPKRAIPEWVRALSENERIGRGFYHGFTRTSRPNEDYKPMAWGAIVIGLIIGIAALLGWTWGWSFFVGVCLIIAGFSVNGWASQENDEYRQHAYSDEKIAETLETEQRNVELADDLVTRLNAWSVTVEVPPDFALGSWGVGWEFMRPGQNGTARFRSTLTYAGRATMTREVSIGPYGVDAGEPEAVCERLEDAAFKAVRKEIAAIRYDRRIIS